MKNKKTDSSECKPRVRPSAAKFSGSKELTVEYGNHTNDPIRAFMTNSVPGLIILAKLGDIINDLFCQVTEVTRLRGATGSTSLLVEEYCAKRKIVLNWRLGAFEVSEVRILDTKAEPEEGWINLGINTNNKSIHVKMVPDSKVYKITNIKVLDLFSIKIPIKELFG